MDQGARSTALFFGVLGLRLEAGSNGIGYGEQTRSYESMAAATSDVFKRIFNDFDLFNAKAGQEARGLGFIEANKEKLLEKTMSYTGPFSFDTG